MRERSYGCFGEWNFDSPGCYVSCTPFYSLDRMYVVVLTIRRIIYSYFEIAAKEGDIAGLKGMVLG